MFSVAHCQSYFSECEVLVTSHCKNVNFNKFYDFIAVNLVMMFLELKYCTLLHNKYCLPKTGKRKVILNVTVLQYFVNDADCYINKLCKVFKYFFLVIVLKHEEREN